MDDKYRSRKWKAFQFGVLSNIALLLGGFLVGTEFVALQTILFAFYGAANVMEKRNSK